MFRSVIKIAAILSILPAATTFAVERNPVLIGVDGAFGLPYSTSAQAIEKGILVAIDEINQAGGVLSGRPLKLVKKDNRSMSARGIQNIKDFADMKDLVAVMSGRFSPVVLETIPELHKRKLINLAAWSAANTIINNGRNPNYIFRLSLRDALAMPTMIKYAVKRGASRIGLLLTNTSWGRSNLGAAEGYLRKNSKPALVGVSWYNWRDQTLIKHYTKLKNQGAQAIILVANDDEAATLVREIAALPKQDRMPIYSHWGVTGGDFTGQAGPALQKVDFTVVQTISFFNFAPEKVEKFLAVTKRLFGISTIEGIESPVGIAHAYDLTHILARAINLAGTTDRAAIRSALEKVTNYDGLIKYFQQPFTPDNHEALGENELLMARYNENGVLIPIE
jgi:branched-chain amino acid transport system substrate-binding protein